MTNHPLPRIFVAAILFGNAAIYGQISQERPELCGKREFVPIPSNIMATRDTLVVTPLHAATGVKTTFFGIVEQVCPIPSDRYLIFARAATGGSYEVMVLNGHTGALIDKFRAYNPVVSPNQHWVVYQAFYSRSSDSSDEYLLYDLTKSAVGNTMPNLSWSTEGIRGKVIYPVVADGKPFHNFGLSDEQRHGCLSDSFYWSSDSSAIVFADKVQDTESIVLVTLDQNGSKTFIHRVSSAEAKSLDYFRDMEVSADSQVVRMRFNDIISGEKKLLILHFADFEPAKLEFHPEIIPTVETIVVPYKGKENQE